MENPAEKPMEIIKLRKYGKMLMKKMGMFPASAGKKSSADKSSGVPPVPPAVHCDDLFHASQGQWDQSTKGIDVNASAVVAAHIAAQNHFSLRPNIYI